MPLVDQARNLRPEVTADSLHLNSTGYEAAAQWLAAAMQPE